MFCGRGASRIPFVQRAVREAFNGKDRVSTEVNLGPGALSACPLAYPPETNNSYDLGVGGRRSLRTACNV